MSTQPQDTSNNASNSTSDEEEDIYDTYPDFTQIAWVRTTYVLAYVLVMGLAVSGNALVCWTVASRRRMRTAVNLYIANLAACDLAVGAFVAPVKLAELAAPASWGLLSDGVCTAAVYLQTCVVFASVLTLVAICIERYMAVVHPLESRSQQTRGRARRILVGVWAAPALVSAPFLAWPAEAVRSSLRSPLGAMERLSCAVGLPGGVRRPYYTALFVLLYAVPGLVVAGTCARVARCLLEGIPVSRQGSVRRQEAGRRKIAKMVLMVVVAFAVSWTPYFVVSLVTQWARVNFLEEGHFFFTMLNLNLLAFLNSCVNPFIYAAMSTRFRNGFLRCFRLFCCFCMSVMEQKTTGQTDTSTRRVRFRCEPTCLIQSSSDGCSNVENNASSKTLVDPENSSILKTRRGRFIAHYIKKNEQIIFNRKDPQDLPSIVKQAVSNDIEDGLKYLDGGGRALFEKCQLITTSSSTGLCSDGIDCEEISSTVC